MEAEEVQTKSQPVIAKGDHYTLKFLPGNLGLVASLFDEGAEAIDKFAIGLADFLPYAQGQSNVISTKSEQYKLDIWRDWLRLKGKLSTLDNKVIDTFEVKIGDIFQQLGIDLKDIISGKIKMPGWLNAITGFLK